MLRMLKVAAVALTSVAATTLPAAAEAIDVSTVTCGEIVTQMAAEAKGKAKAKTASTAEGPSEAEKMGLMLIWLHGMGAPEERGTVIDYTGLDTFVVNLMQYCSKNPKIGLKTASERFTGDKAPKLSKNSLDVSTIKCSAVATEMDEKTSIALSWLAGWHAGYKDEPMFDIAELGQKFGEFGEYCKANPNKGFATAAQKVFGKE